MDFRRAVTNGAAPAGLRFQGNGQCDVLRPECPVRIVLLVTRVLGNSIGSARLDSQVIVGVGQAIPRQSDRQFETRQMQQAAIVVFGGRPYVNIEFSYKKKEM